MLDEEARRSHRVPIAILLTLQLVVYLGGMATAGAEEPTTDPSATGSATPAPTIVSDKDDYAPGETVTLTGESWQPGETVHIRVDDDQERTWSHDADVTAGEDGRFTYQFALPTHFVAVYTVVATGELSGVAVTSFTDGTVEVRNASTTPAGVTATYKLERWTNPTCLGTAAESKTFSITGPGGLSGTQAQVSTGNSESIRLTLVSVTGGTFVKWTRDTSPPLTEGGAVDYTPASCESVASPTQWLIFGHFVAANQAPVATDDAYSTDEDTALNVSAPGVLGNDTDANGNPLTAALVSGPSHGTLTLNADGSFTYTPTANYNGSDSFTYKANDGSLDSNVATVWITVNPVNDAPVATDDAYPTDEDTTLNVPAPGVLGNDTDEDGDALTAVLVAGPSHGTLTLNADGSFTYTPHENSCGSDSFTYQANDGTADSNAATVSITVTCVNDAPTIAYTDAPDTVDESTTTEHTYTFSITDPDSSAFVFAAGYPTCGTGGTLVTGSASISGNSGTFKCRFPDGPASPEVKVKILDDESAASNEISQEVTVANVAPTVTLSGPSAADEGQTKTYTFTTSDPGDEVFSFASGSPSCGTGGTLVGTPTIDPSTGAGSFDCSFPDGPASPTVSVTVSDGDGGSGSDSIGVTVANVDPTVTLSGDATADEGQTKTYTFTTSDPGDEVFSLDAVSCGTGGTLVGSASFTPATGAGSFDCSFPDGPASPTVSVTVSDGDGGSDSDSIGVTVANVAPEITSASFNAATVSCAANTVTLTVGFTDPGADTWIATINWGDGSPVETVDPATSPFSATHTYALAGVYAATVVVADDDGGSQSATPQLTVNYTIVGDGFLPPINNTGHGMNPSIFKYGSTIPVKIKVQDCDGSYPSTLAPKVYIQKMSGTVPVDGELEPNSTSAADTGNTMRFSGAPDFQYIYNLATKSFSSDPTSTWQLIVKILATGQEIKTTIALKK